MMTDRRLSRLLAVVFVAGCSSGNSVPPPVRAVPTPTPAPSSSARLASAAFTIVIPVRGGASADARHRNFISPSTDGIAVTVTHQTAGVIDYDVTTNFDVAAGSTTACAGTVPQTCTLSFPAPVAVSPDVDTFTFTLYDKAPGGTPPTFGSSADELGAGTTTASIVANAANSVTAYVDGLPASIAFGALVVSGDGYLGFTAPVTVTAYDVDLNPIAAGTYDPYAPPVVLAVVEPKPPTGSTTLAVTPPNLSSASPPAPACNAAQSGVASASVCRSADAVTATYQLASGATLDLAYYATIGSGSSTVANTSPLFVSPMFVKDSVDTNSPSLLAPYYTQGGAGVSPVITLNAGTGTVSLIEPGASKQGTTPSFSATQNAACAGVIATNGLTATSQSTYTIAGVVPALPTSGCVVTFTDNFGGTVALDVVN